MAGVMVSYQDVNASAFKATPAENRKKRVERNRQIAVMKDDGATWIEIATAVGISDRQARRAYLEALVNGQEMGKNPQVDQTDAEVPYAA